MGVAMKPNLLELMNAEDTASITAVRTNFLTETRRDSSIALRKLRLLDPFIAVESCNRLLGGGDQILFINLLVFGFFAAFPNYLSSYTHIYF